MVDYFSSDLYLSSSLSQASERMISKKGAVGVVAAVGSWFAAYWFIADEIDKSSSIVNQSIFNININENAEKNMKLPVKIASGVRGRMNQFKGFAEINFDVVDKMGNKFIVEVDANRRGLNWRTNKLTLRTLDGQEMKFI